MLINGKATAWADIVTTLAGVILTRITELNYEKKREKTDNYGAGSKPVSRSYGKEEFMADITLHSDEVEALTNAAPERDLTLIAPFDITVTSVAALGAAPVRNVLRGVEFKNNPRAMKQGDAVFEVKLELIVGDIEY
jgi:hypothetical protein